MPRLVEIGSVVLEKKKILNFINAFSQFRNYSPLEKGCALHLNKFENPDTKEGTVLRLVVIGLVALEKTFEFCQCILLFRIYLIYLNKH